MFKSSRRNRKLKRHDDYPKIKEIIRKQNSDFNIHEKLHFILYVVYRYRNNIFHGSKGVESWIRFKPQMERCVKVMIEILNSKHNERTLD